ncbi:MAG TPA: DUF3592 domain-containing protein [Streptosporangiaceae bacterium]|nr:DUF3592 domain-containing protein [Streptosporangiaceae bacterium]
MLVVVAVWFAIAGGVAVLAGLSGLHRSRRLRRHGVRTWGMAVRSPVPAPARDEDGSPVPVLIQFTLADGRVMERIAPQSGRGHALRPGQQMLVWYNPDDPDDVLVNGRETRLADRAFLVAGALFIAIGVGIAAF